MRKIYRLFVSKVFALLLTFLLCHGSYPWGDSTGGVSIRAEKNFAAALEEYQTGLYEPAAAKLEAILDAKEGISTGLQAKVHLLLGACYQESGQDDRAAECFVQLKKMLDQRLIDQIPVIPGVDPESLTGYRRVFAEESLFKFKKPVPVSEIMNKNVVQAPRKSIEEKKKEKKKKKFPWLIAIGSVVIIGTAAVLLLTSKKSSPPEIPEIVWVYIPAGEFLMGDNFAEGGADELPAHSVYLDEYQISKFEITYNQYIMFCDDTSRRKPPPPNQGTGDPYDLAGDYPVGGISWDEAKAFCEWLSQRTGRNINLPTEAQWEKAARGANETRYPWGNNLPDCTLANYVECKNSGELAATLKPVNSCSTGVSPYGIFNMAGNASEWCRDWYSSTYYSTSPEKNPLGPVSGSFRVLRGGSIEDNAAGLRSTKRSFDKPASAKGCFGFRIVREN